MKYELAPEENASSSTFGASAKSKTSKTKNGELVDDGHSSKSGDKVPILITNMLTIVSIEKSNGYIFRIGRVCSEQRCENSLR